MHTLRTAITLFLTYKRAENLSPRTIAWYEDNLNRFAHALYGQPPVVAPLDAIRPSHIVTHLADMHARYSPSSVEGRYRALYAFFNWLEDCEELGRPPSPIGHGRRRQVKRPRTPEAEPLHVPYEDYRRLADSIDLANWLDYRDYCLVSYLFWTGLRRSELLDLRIEDIDFTHGALKIRNGKGNKQRLTPLDPDLLASTIAYLGLRPAYPDDWLWLSSDHAHTGIRGPLTATGLRLMLQRRARRANVPYYHPHAWRHGYAMAMLNAGVEMSAVSAMMGHSSVKVTEDTYARWLIHGLQTQYRKAAAAIKSTAPDS